MDIKERLIYLREKRGYKKAEVARLLKLPYTTYNNYERGDCGIGSELLRDLSVLYGVTTDYILGLEDDSAEEPLYSAKIDPLVNELYANPELRTLLDATSSLDKEAIEEITAIAKRIQNESR
jgi:transcriptional regulator with XRE-family HTH domain